jgi:hypothetical protein
MARHVPATNATAAKPHPATLDELKRAAAASRGETHELPAQRTHWSFLADI